MKTAVKRTNVDILHEIENRMNHDKYGNLVLFPVKFNESKMIFTEVDAIDNEIARLKSRRAELSKRGDMIMEKEYMEKEYYRLAHEFLSEVYMDDDLELQSIYNNIHHRLKYKNSKPISDHEGRFFPTIKAACEYHEVPYACFMNRRRKGFSLEECFMKGRVPYTKGRK